MDFLEDLVVYLVQCERDFTLLTNIAAEQKEILAQFGPNNPIVDLKKAVRML